MALKSFNVNEDVVTTEITVTDGFFDGGKGIVAGTSLTTSSLDKDFVFLVLVLFSIIKFYLV